MVFVLQQKKQKSLERKKIHVVTVNWSDLAKAAGESGFDAVPAGSYDVFIESCEAKTASTGKNMLKTRFKIENGPKQGSSIFNNFVLSPENPNALAFFFRHMSSLGLGSSYFESNPPLERVAADLMGRRCRIEVSIRTWNDTQQNQVDRVLPPASGPSTVTNVGASAAGGLSTFASPATPATPAVPSPGAPTTAAPAPAVPSVAGKGAKPAAPATPPPPPPAPAGTSSDDLPF